MKVRVVVHPQVDQSLSHAIVKRKRRRIVEDKVDQLLKLVRTLWEEKSEISRLFKLLDVLGGHTIAESVGD